MVNCEKSQGTKPQAFLRGNPKKAAGLPSISGGDVILESAICRFLYRLCFVLKVVINSTLYCIISRIEWGLSLSQGIRDFRRRREVDLGYRYILQSVFLENYLFLENQGVV